MSCKKCAGPLPPYEGRGKGFVYCSPQCKASCPVGHGKCACCGTGFDIYRGNRQKRYCSTACANGVLNAARALALATCPICRKAFKPVIGGYARKRWCSQQCARDARKALHPVVVSTKFAHCPCGSLFRPKGSEVYCSDECRSAAYAGKQQALLTKRECRTCGTQFIPQFGSGPYQFCSAACRHTRQRTAAQAASKKRKAKQRGVDVESFDPVDVLNRDRWTCRLCGMATPQALRGSIEPNAPELDHIVPISRGGMHTKANTRCLCRACNARKGSMLDSELMQAAA